MTLGACVAGDITVVPASGLRASLDDFVFIWGFAVCCERGGGASSSVRPSWSQSAKASRADPVGSMR